MCLKIDIPAELPLASAAGRPTPLLGTDDLRRFINEKNIQATILPLAEHTTTVSEAALALDVATDNIIKSLVFWAQNEPILVINNGIARVDRRKLAVFLAVGRKRIKFATPEQALEITGYVVGSMPPFGHSTKLRTLVDTAVSGLKVVFGGGGALDAMMRLTSPELLRITGADVLELSE